MSSDTPRTAAGRRLLGVSYGDEPIMPDDWFGSILDIEDEAREQALAEAEAAIDKKYAWYDSRVDRTVIGYNDVLAALAALRKPVQPQGQE